MIHGTDINRGLHLLPLGVHRLANTLRTSAGALDNLRSTRDVFSVQLQQDGKGASGSGAAGGASREAAAAGGSSSSAGLQSLAPYECPVTQLPCTRCGLL